MSNVENFRISSGLKNLIGKELITDEFVAVFELVKNSFDASSTKVEIIFIKPIDLEKGKIIIRDNGKGMNKNDLKNKWLFVAFSAKNEGTEDSDYRDRIKFKRFYAGAKGVGRFSCDRLGKYLYLESVKKEKESKIESLFVNWEEFEEKPLVEFKDVNVIHKTLHKSNNYGTVLEITGLRDVWDRQRLLKLKRSLSKLINPNQENDTDNFSIQLICEEELLNDQKESDEWNKVNSQIKNFLFEKLNLKTTQIKCSINEDGKVITTILTDRGKRIYTLKEHNQYSYELNSQHHYLNNINIHLFQLNRAAKTNFAREMGISSVEYGSVFLYKNGFRIYPFGETGDDSLKIDRRKQQGYSRNLGTRDLLGRIEIYGLNENLKESTSRAEGLIKSEEYFLLLDFFENKVLKRLEDYVVNIIEWGDDRIFELDEKVNLPGLSPEDVKKEITDYIKKLSNAKNVISISYDEKFIDILNENVDQSVNKSLRVLARKAINQNDKEALKQAIKLKNEWNNLISDTIKADLKATSEEKLRKETETKLKLVESQNSFLINDISDDTKNLESMLHHIGLTTNFIKTDISNLVKAIQHDADKEVLVNIVKRISKQNEKIISFSNYFKKVKFDPQSTKLEQDIISFTNEYIEHVYKLREDLRVNRELLGVKITTPKSIEFKFKFNPIDVVIVLDNLISNSTKHGASFVELIWKRINDKSIMLFYKDNGNGIKDNIIDNIFDFGFTTSRRGSGIGLYHVKEIINQMNGNIEVYNKVDKGVEFHISFKK